MSGDKYKHEASRLMVFCNRMHESKLLDVKDMKFGFLRQTPAAFACVPPPSTPPPVEFPYWGRVVDIYQAARIHPSKIMELEAYDPSKSPRLFLCGDAAVNPNKSTFCAAWLVQPMPADIPCQGADEKPKAKVKAKVATKSKAQ